MVLQSGNVQETSSPPPQHSRPPIRCSYPIIASCSPPPLPPFVSNMGFQYLIWDPNPQVLGEAGGGCARVGGGSCLHRHDISAGGGGGGHLAGVLSREPRDRRVRLLKERVPWLCHVHYDEMLTPTGLKITASTIMPHRF